MLTKKQLELLKFIQKRMQRDGVPPSFDEMKEALDLRSKSGIHRLITALEERGFIRRLAHRARAIEIIKLPDSLDQTRAEPGFAPRVIDGDRPSTAPRSTPARTEEGRSVALMGRIAAGTPIEAISQATQQIAVPSGMIDGRAEHYALEVRGDSMIGVGINDGDIVVIREQTNADNGDIVVALVDGAEATLKRLRRQKGMIALEAANPAYETRILPDSRVNVQGRLVGLIRTY